MVKPFEIIPNRLHFKLMPGLIVSLVMMFVGCGPSTPSQETHKEQDETAQMVALLDNIAKRGNFQNDGFLNNALVAHLEKELPKQNVTARATQLWNLARSYLLAGRTVESIEKLEAVKALAEKHPEAFNPKSIRAYMSLLAMAYMRLGEQENCVAGHDPQACIFPIAGGGLHQKKTGSQRAISYYEKLLEADPADLNARWLLNLAHMTLNQYPDQVPQKWLVAPETMLAGSEFKTFENIAGSVGLDTMGLAGSVVVEDFNGDGFLDLLTSSWGLQDNLIYFENDGKGGYQDRTEQAGLKGIIGGLNMIQSDVNNDGFMDVLVLRGAWRKQGGHHPNSLLINQGGQFQDRTKSSGLMTFSPTQTAAFADFDRDGWIDVFIGNETSNGDVHPARLFRNRGNGHFEDITQASGLSVLAFVKAVVWGDIDNDGDPDLYISSLNAPNQLLRNDGPNGNGNGWLFTDITHSAGVAEPFQSFPCWFFDYDNDGWLDLFVSGYGREFVDTAAGAVLADILGSANAAELPRMYRNLGGGEFEDVTHRLGLSHVYLTMGCGFGDLDNDGWLDFYLGTGAPDFQALVPNVMLRNRKGKAFDNVTVAGGFGHLQKGHGIAFADFDHDGDQDIYAVMGGAYSGDAFPNALFENPGHDGSWVVLHLEGRQSSRDARGARLKLEVTTPEGSRWIHGEIASGGSFGATTLRYHMGLGQATSVKQLIIHWPVSGEQSVSLGAINQHYRIVEGEQEPEVLALSAIPFQKSEPSHHHH